MPLQIISSRVSFLEKREGQSQFGLADRTVLLFFSSAGSHSDQCHCRGYGGWHFLLPGTLKTLPCPPTPTPNPPTACLPSFPSLFFFIFLFAPLLSLPFFEMSKPASNLLLPLSESVFILTAPLPLCSTYHSISLFPLWFSIPPLLSLPPCFLLILLSSCL